MNESVKISAGNARPATQVEIDKANAAFWDTLCGSHLAQVLGITDNGPGSLRRFDRWFLNFYPYLGKYVPLKSFYGKKVVEVGLGYGTLSQLIAESGADYTAIDVSAGPVGMVRHRLRQDQLPGRAIQRSFLDNGLESNSIDAVVAIGCFHHTGDLQGCFDEAYRILKPGGTAHLMVYNRYSHRRWSENRWGFIKEAIAEFFGLLRTETANEHERGASDRNLEGEAAPETVYVSQRQVKRMMRKFSSVTTALENMDESNDPKWARDKVLDTWGRWMGLDLYIVARK